MISESNKPSVYVAFQGGGMLGIAHLGAWQEIVKHFEIIGTAGTSSGSIIAALCAAGFSPEELIQKEQIREEQIDWAGFVDGKSAPRLLIESIVRGLFGLGACTNGDRFSEWFEGKLGKRYPQESKLTFAMLYKHKKTYLEVIACDLKEPDRSPVVSFSKDERGHTFISDAVRASISIPGNLSANITR